MDCCTLLWPHSILKATKQGTRIYVFVGNRNMLVRIKLELEFNDCIPQFLSGEVYEADDDREALWWGSLHGDLSVSRGKQHAESKLVTNWCLQSVKLDERMFFLWTKEDLADTKKLGTSCEDMEAYHERLRVRIYSTFSGRCFYF